jgi:hypothetical protein
MNTPMPKLPTRADAPLALGGVLGLFATVGGFDALQASVFDAIAARLYDTDRSALTALEPADLMSSEIPEAVRHQVLHLAVVLELVAHPTPVAQARAVERAAKTFGIPLAAVHAAREMADRHLVLLRADLRRSSWYAHETEREAAHGRLIELVRSKVAYEGLEADRTIARRWETLRTCPPGSWGRGVADFYEAHRFPFPGERHGIYEIGALHDFVHVLAGYDSSPDGEIDVFAFIAASMPAAQGLILLAVTLGMFQTGTIHRVEGRVVKIARENTLDDPGAVDRFADALARGQACRVDVMGGIDHFALAPEPLDDLRTRFGIPPKAAT